MKVTGLVCRNLISVFSLLIATMLPCRSDEIMVRFPETFITQTEFEVSYRSWLKSNSSEANQQDQSLNDFLTALIRLKQLVLAAEDLETGKDSVFQNTLADILDQTRASGRLTDDIETWLLYEAYLRRHYLVDASQILVAERTNDADPNSLAHSKAVRLKDRLENQEADFELLADQLSDDPSTSENKGRMGFFTVFDRLYPIESAAYQTPVNKVSAPVRTRFGYHLIRVNGRYRIEGRKRAAHILIKHSPSSENDQASDAERQIKAIYDQLESSNFTELAMQYSQDYASSPKGGDLGFDRLIDRLERVKLTLPPGSYSEPIKTRLGWHIVKVTDFQAFESFPQSRASLAAKLELSARVQGEIDLIQNRGLTNFSVSPVWRSYVDDLLCRMLLSREMDIEFSQYAERADLIEVLLGLETTPEIQALIDQNPAEIVSPWLLSIEN